MEFEQDRQLIIRHINLEKASSRIFGQGVMLMMLVFLAFSRWMPGGDPLNPESGSRAYIEMGLLICAFLLMIFLWSPKVVLSGFKSPTFVILLIFGIWASITSAWAPNPILAIGKSIELILGSFVVATIAFQSANSTASFVKIVLYSLIILVVFQLFINLVYYHTFFPIKLFGLRPRFILGFNHPNMSTMYFSTIVLISTYLFYKQVQFLKRFFYGSLILIFLVFIYLTDSRTTMLSVLIGILLIALLQLRSKRFFYALSFFGIIIATIIGIALTSGIFDQRISLFLSTHPDFLTLNGRTDLWEIAFSNANGLNLTGLGYFNSRFLFLDEKGAGWGYSLHNSYMEIFFTTGWIGFLLLPLFYFSTYSLLKKINKFSLPIVFLLYLSIEGLMESRLFTPSIPFLLACGFIFYQQFLIQNSKTSQQSNTQFTTPLDGTEE